MCIEIDPGIRLFLAAGQPLRLVEFSASASHGVWRDWPDDAFSRLRPVIEKGSPP